MKFLKKLSLLILCLVACLAIGIVSACKDKKEEGGTEELAEYIYKVRVQSEGGFGLKNVVVGLYDGDTLVKEKTTSAQGNAYFTEEDGIELGEYEVRLSEVPAGWKANEEITYKTSTTSQSDLTVAMKSKLITDETIPSNKLYQLGDVMYDFTITDCDNQSHTLSTLLEEKKMVMLNFWATWCGPCKSEFPAMQNAYVESTENVEILAISTTDDQAAVKDYKSENGLSFPMAGGTDLPARFGVSSVPATIIIDRYGVISYWHVGSMTAKNDFIGLFDKFTGENYLQTVIGADGYEGGDNENTDETEQVKPNVSAPSTSDVDALLNSNGGFSSSWDNGEYSWPFTIQTHESGDKALYASNKGVHNSYSLIYIDFTASENDALFFDGAISTEENADFLHVFIDGNLIHSISGNSEPKWETYCAYVFKDGEAGKHTLSFSFVKDANMSGGEDEVWIKNLRIGTKDEISSVDIIRNAATQRNEKPEQYTAQAKQYKNYVTTAYNQTDGYYHVGSADGPLLFANLMKGSLWNKYDLWQLAYNELLIVDGMNVGAALEDYAWAATNSKNGYVPVTKELKHVLQTVVKANNVEGMTADSEYHLADYEEEWLEVCVYFDHYGSGDPVGDSTRGITFNGAKPLTLGKNTIECDVALVPLGIKHKFTPTTSGVYHLYSIVSEEYEDTSASRDPQCWIFANDQKTQLAYSDDTLLNSPEGNYENFDIYLYMEANQTYYCLFAFFLNATGTFDMQLERVGDTKDFLTHAASQPFSYNEVTKETYQPDAIAYEWDDMGTTDESDDLLKAENGSYVYLDMTNATTLFPSQSFERIIEQAEAQYTGSLVSKRLFYLNVNGETRDYTNDMKAYLFKARRNNGELHGMVQIDRKLFDILLAVTKEYDGFGGVENSWQRMCYYYEKLGV